MLCSSQIREVAASQMSLEDIVQLAPSELAKVEESIGRKFDSDTKKLFLRAVSRSRTLTIGFPDGTLRFLDPSIKPTPRS